MSDPISFSINGQSITAAAEDGDMALVDFLHEREGLTGTKFCCGIAVCHACTVAVRPQKNAPLEKVLSCTTPVEAVRGAEIMTIEGLGAPDKLEPLQEAFLEAFAFQCGYCTSGFLMSATVLLERLKISPVSEDELDGQIERWVGDNICRCSGYVRYVEAIRGVALQQMRG
jgi:aerobic-type carbon monoxide dehydrogenase small subunit (CoxS/CutS family)